MKPNFKCKVCGKEYYCCAEGISKLPYMQIVCSKECFEKWESIIQQKKAPKQTRRKASQPVVSPAEEKVSEE